MLFEYRAANTFTTPVICAAYLRIIACTAARASDDNAVSTDEYLNAVRNSDGRLGVAATIFEIAVIV